METQLARAVSNRNDRVALLLIEKGCNLETINENRLIADARPLLNGCWGFGVTSRAYSALNCDTEHERLQESDQEVIISRIKCPVVSIGGDEVVVEDQRSLGNSSIVKLVYKNASKGSPMAEE